MLNSLATDRLTQASAFATRPVALSTLKEMKAFQAIELL